ncbi:MAG: polysaccharide biosynthesis related protein [Gemmatimonadota bacterium]|nr:MAG: polysaccharide biosynthesis related protein [Gemmatimonadota bacterium]
MDTRGQIRGSSLLLLGRILSLVTNLVVQVLVVRTLSKEGYGAFAYALSIATIGEGLVSLGLHRAVARYVPIYDEQGDRARAMGSMVLALGSTVAAGIAAVLLVWGLRGWIAGELVQTDGAVMALVILSVLAPIQGLDRLFVGFFSVFGRPRAIFVRRFLVTPALRLLVIATLILQGGGVVMLAAGYVVTGVLGLAVYGALLLRVLRERRYVGSDGPGEWKFPARELFGFALPLLTTEIVFAGINHADAVMLGQMAGPEDVASLRAVYPVARLNQVVLEMFAVLFTPLAARYFQRKDFVGLNELYWRTATWIAILSFPIFAVTFSLARPLTELLFGERYADSGSLLALLTFGYYAHAALGPNGMMLNVYKMVKYVVVVNVLAFALNVGGNLWLIPKMGVQGAAIATAGTLIVHNLLKQNGLRRAAGVRALDPAALRPYAVLILGVSVLGVLELVWRPSVWVAGGAAAVVSVLVLAVNRRALNVLDTFPELGRLPWLGRMLGGKPRPGDSG